MSDTLESLDYARDNVYGAMDSMHEVLDGIDEAVESLNEVPEPVNEGLESKVAEKPFTLIDFCGVLAVIAIVAGIAMPGMLKYLPKTEPKKEYVVSYESPYVRQLSDSALKNVMPVQRSARLYEMDKDKDEVITEAEVIKYVRENYAKLK